MPNNDTVYIASRKQNSRQGKYHTRDDCQYLEQAHNIREVELSKLYDGFEECLYCKGETPNPGGKGTGHIESLKAAAKEHSQ